ncbi:hypothetical protein PSHT_12626 [Puccinia striiformis]|uniref:Uncharacterized protein n=1 Tax=Puccinia striiformis TaxID=27350 RepID=A0A2S4UVC1_9BASI|nr:hypothetical protein PSHT_12626 [Puccinia striiformis]
MIQSHYKRIKNRSLHGSLSKKPHAVGKGADVTDVITNKARLQLVLLASLLSQVNPSQFNFDHPIPGMKST